ncbi:NSFL1 cofactor p47-like [Limulus polyphemus]|uniref:NSFL1 cofactor p47-like n=1 Tax=Limulus polyphemus TaxID=6850 RepID=A0ABM1BSH6_LIMPO|nr:NSFL1 cofactor p47-like [Limulus polyphemus]
MEGNIQEQDELIKYFCSITDVDCDRAKLYLEAAAWNLDFALSSFYEETDDLGDPVVVEPDYLNKETDGTGNTVVEEPDELNKEMSSQPTSAASGSSSSRFVTLSSLMKTENDDEGQAFYAGGSERSGQQILGPGKRKSGNDFVSEIFKAAKEHGAEVVEPGSSSHENNKVPVFKGTGYKLGATNDDTEVVHSGVLHKPRPPVDVCLRLWKNGFSVDDGPLREYTDPANKEFFESVRRGEIPRELVQAARGEVNLNMEDHRQEDFMASKRKLEVFSGEGHRLGSPVPHLQFGQSGTSNQDTLKNQQDAQNMLVVKESEPTTSIQIRLADGSRMVAKLNHSHTVGDLRKYIVTARPEYAASVFALMTTFPNKELTEDNLTLEEASLLNSVVVQKLK